MEYRSNHQLFRGWGYRISDDNFPQFGDSSH